MVKAIIMAGGKGTRIRPLTLIRPKPMVPVANRPIMDYIIAKVKNSGYNDIILTLNYLQGKIKNEIKNKYKELNVKYTVEDFPMGTAGGIKKAQNYIDDSFFVLSGDVLVDVDLNKLLKFHREKKAIATLVLKHVDDPTHFGIAVVDDDGQITNYLEKPSPDEVFSNIANTGTYIFEPEIFDYIKSGEEVDFSHDVFPVLIEERAGIYGYEFDGYWNDVGRPDTFLLANYDVLNRKIAPEPPGKKIKESVDRLGDIWIGNDVQIDERVRVSGPVAIGDNCVIGKGCKISKNTVIGKNAHIEENTHIKGSVLFSNVVIKANSHLKDCIIDTNCVVEEGSIIESGVILGNKVHIGFQSVIKSSSSITSKTEISSDSIVDANYTLIAK
ncbi:MAG: sugar phosphate nucleotidyltransferase [Methanobacterium sp.]